MPKPDPGPRIHQQFLELHHRLEDSLRRYEQESSEVEQYRALFQINKCRILLYWNQMQKYFWLRSCGYEHNEIRHWLYPF